LKGQELPSCDFCGRKGHTDTAYRIKQKAMASVKLNLNEDAKPYHGKAFTVPKNHHDTLKHEIERLVELGVLKRCSDSEWSAPTLILPKKNATVRFISDFRKLNEMLKRMPYPIQKIAQMLEELEKIAYATSLDLNMGYYTIKLVCDVQKCLLLLLLLVSINT
jgi:hypothetical protein